MKKLNYLFAALFMAAAIVSCSKDNSLTAPTPKPLPIKYTINPVLPAQFCGTHAFTIWAGQNINAGDMTVSNDGTYLYITGVLNSSTVFANVKENVKIWVGTTIFDVRPEAGSFPIKFIGSNNTFSVQIALSGISGYNFNNCNSQSIYLIVHLDLMCTDDSGVTTAQTGFGGDQDGNGPAWWKYVAYVPACCNESNCTYSDETAWGGANQGPRLTNHKGQVIGNWWFYVDATSLTVANPLLDQPIYAGQKLTLGTVSLTELATGMVQITFTPGNLTLQNINRSIKIQGYNVLPTSAPTPGLFTTFSSNGTSFPTITVPLFNYYCIHMDVFVTTCK